MFIARRTKISARSVRNGMCRTQRTSLYKRENVLFLKLDLELLQQRQIFVLKRSPLVMPFLVLNVTNDHVQLRMSVREPPVTFLPREFPASQFLAVYPIRRVRLNVTNKLRNRHRRPQADQDVKVIGHAVDLKQFLP